MFTFILDRISNRIAKNLQRIIDGDRKSQQTADYYAKISYNMYFSGHVLRLKIVFQYLTFQGTITSFLNTYPLLTQIRCST